MDEREADKLLRRLGERVASLRRRYAHGHDLEAAWRVMGWQDALRWLRREMAMVLGHEVEQRTMFDPSTDSDTGGTFDG